MSAFAVAPFWVQAPQCKSAETPITARRKQRIRARVAYDGTNYSGWQFQPNDPTVQAILEQSISRKFGEQIRAVGASRTDAGVHARGQGVHFDVPLAKALKDEADIRKFEFTLNQMLPADVRVKHVALAPDVRPASHGTLAEGPPLGHNEERPWHAIYNSTGKLYTYRFSTGPVLDPLQRLYRHHEWRADRFGFSEEVLREVTKKFVGSHDFSAFTNMTAVPSGYEPPVLINPVRTVRAADVIREEDGCYKIEFRIDGAMYRMIRNIVGTILDVSCGKMELSYVETLFRLRDRRLVPKSAPARGLCLEEVYYENWSM